MSAFNQRPTLFIQVLLRIQEFSSHIFFKIHQKLKKYMSFERNCGNTEIVCLVVVFSSIFSRRTCSKINFFIINNTSRLETTCSIVVVTSRSLNKTCLVKFYISSKNLNDIQNEKKHL